MNATDTLAPIALQVLLLLGVVLLGAELAASWRRRRARQAAAFDAALRALARLADPPQQ